MKTHEICKRLALRLARGGVIRGVPTMERDRREGNPPDVKHEAFGPDDEELHDPLRQKGGAMKPIKLGYWPGKRWKQARAVFGRGGLSPTLTAEMGSKGNNFVYVTERRRIADGQASGDTPAPLR